MTRPAPVSCLLLVLLFTGCAMAPVRQDGFSSALEPRDETRLGRAVVPLERAHPGQSGVHPLSIGQEAFAARVMLARAAERSIDAQYYLWNDDRTGMVIDSAELARRLSAAFDEEIPLDAYEVTLQPNGHMQWIERSQDATRVHRDEPGGGAAQRAQVALWSVLPLEWLL